MKKTNGIRDREEKEERSNERGERRELRNTSQEEKVKEEKKEKRKEEKRKKGEIEGKKVFIRGGSGIPSSTSSTVRTPQVGFNQRRSRRDKDSGYVHAGWYDWSILRN